MFDMLRAKNKSIWTALAAGEVRVTQGNDFLLKRQQFAESIGAEGLYEYIDQFPLYAGLHTIGNKLFTYDLFRQTIGIPGDIVEFGCWKGSNLMYLAKLKQLMEPHSPKRVFGFDNFSGLPEPTDSDGAFAKTQAGKYHGNEDILRRTIELFGFNELVQLVVGNALETIPDFQSNNPHSMMSFAYLDFDLYEPTRLALEWIDSCLSVGGVIVFDEACTQAWPGETLAMKEFLSTTDHHYDMISNTISRQPTVALKRIR